MHVKQLKRQDLDSALRMIERSLDRALDLARHAAALGGVNGVDTAASNHPSKGGDARTAHKSVGLRQIERELHRIFDAKLDTPAQIDQVAVAGEQERFVGCSLLLEPRAGCVDGLRHGKPACGLTGAVGLPRRYHLGRIRREAELDALYPILLYDEVRLERPGQTIVQPWSEHRRDDGSKSQPQAYLPRLHCE